MELIKSKNKFKHVEQSLALKQLSQQCDTSFIGDEMFIANKNMHFFKDEKFNLLMEELAKSDIYKGMAWRVHFLLWAAEQALKVDGDFMECGVFRGFKSYFLLRYFEERLSKKTYFLCDTYEGIDLSQAHLSPITNIEHNKCNLHAFIVSRFSEFKNVDIVKGSVPNSLFNKNIKKIAFLHLDMNSYMAEIGALDFLWDKISNGGVIILDDFGLYSHKAQMEKELPWFQNKGHKILEFPTGQAMIIKQEG
jgi:hypothetical protein